MNIKTTVCSLLAVLFLISCDNETSELGGSLTPQDDKITVTSDSCYAQSRTIKASDSLLVLSSRCNLGRFTEQGSGSTIQAGFITQLSCIENFDLLTDSVYGIGDHTFPQWFIDAVGEQKPYYAELRLYYTSYFGDPTNTLKIDVFPLDQMVDVNTTYYSDVDPSLFYDETAEPLASLTVSARNMQMSDSLRNIDGYYPSFIIPLPDSIAKHILESYMDPATRHYFADSRAFMENLYKGFYIRCTQGDGTMFYIDRTVFEVNFKCIGLDDDDEPEMQSLMAEFQGNSEVLQLNSIKWTGLDAELADNSCTWIRSPFGLLTEITLPVDSMKGDFVLNSAMLRVMTAVTPATPYKPSVPSTLLLIRKDMLKSFFDGSHNVDNMESYVASYSEKYGTYTYSNIAAMVEKIHYDRDKWLKANNMEADAAGIAAYSQERPDWDKVVLVPVTVNLNAQKGALSYSLDMDMHQVKLIGGDTKIKIKTIRSKF